MANNADLDRLHSAKASLKAFAVSAVEERTLTSAQITGNVNEMIGLIYVTKTTPKYFGGLLRAYFDGMRDVLIQPQTIFRYKIEGKFYSIKGNKDFPSWKTLPRERWTDLGKYGGIYWRGTNNPYFVANSN